MKDQSANRIKLGVFVIVGTSILILGLYFIGSNKNIFKSKINASANFSNIDGLIVGNNVRLNGIVVGSVSKTYAVNDTTIKVEFTIDEDATKFINENSIASIGTDGLLGNNLLSIAPGINGKATIHEGSVLQTTKPFQMDKVMQKLFATNDNIQIISENLKHTTEKFNSPNSLWYLLSDSSTTQDVKQSLQSFNATGKNAENITGNLNSIVQNVKQGKGTLGVLLQDTALSKKLNHTVVNLKNASDSMITLSANLLKFSKQLNNSNGALHTLTNDSAFALNLSKSMENIKDGSANFNENMEALKGNWLLKSYFKKENSK